VNDVRILLSLSLSLSLSEALIRRVVVGTRRSMSSAMPLLFELI